MRLDNTCYQVFPNNKFNEMYESFKITKKNLL